MEETGNGSHDGAHLHSNGLSGKDAGVRKRKSEGHGDTELVVMSITPQDDGEEDASRRKTTSTLSPSTDPEGGLDLGDVENYVPTPPDGGWGWVIVFASFMINVLVDGVAYSFGVMLPDLQQSFQEQKSKISLIGSLLCGVYLFAGPIVSAMTNKYGCRVVVIFGTILATASFSLATRAQDVGVMIGMYGVVGGLGVGMIYLPSIVSVGYYFEKRRAFATGLAVCGSGVGTFAFPPFIEYLLKEYGWRGTILILGGVLLQCCLCGALMRPLVAKLVTSSEPKLTSSKAKKPRAKTIFDRVKETTQKGANLANSIPELVIKERVQQAKLIRQRSLQDNDTVIGSSDSLMVANAARGGQNGGETKDSSSSASSSLPSSPSSPSSGALPVVKIEPAELEIRSRPFIIRAQSEEGETISEEVIHVDPTKIGKQPKPRRPHRSKERLFSSQTSNQHALLNVPGARPAGVGGSRTNLANLSSVSHLHSMRSLNLSAKDLARPLYRKDIFYSGSVMHIPELQSQSDVAGYKANVTTIPGESEFVADPGVTARCINFCCGCLPRPARDVLSEMIDLSLFLDASFMLICLGNLTAFLGFFVPFMFLIDYAVTLGISKDRANFLISIIGIANTVGRVLVGTLADFEIIDSLIITYISIAVCGVATCLCPLVSSYELLATLAAAFGLGVASFVSLSSIVICDRLGLEKLTNGFGLMSMARGVSSMAGPPLAGYMYDSTNSYDYSFFIAGSLLLAGAACHALLHLPMLQRKHLQHQQQRQQQQQEIKAAAGGGGGGGDGDEDEEDEGGEEEGELGPLMGSKPRVIGIEDLPGV